MEQAVEDAPPRRVHLTRQAVVRPTRYRAASQPWIAWGLAAVALLAGGVVGGIPLLVMIGLVLVAVTIRSGWRLVRTLRRLDEVGLSRWSANVVLMLLPHDSGRPHGITRVPVPEGVDRTPEAILRHVLADESRQPTVAPWAKDDAGPRTGGSGPGRVLWLLPVTSALGWLAATVTVLTIDNTGTVARAAAVVVAAMPVVAVGVFVVRYRVALHHDGRLEIRRGLHDQVLRLDHLLQVSGWTWTIDTPRSTSGRRRLHGATMSLVFGDGTHAVLRPAHARDDQLVAQALRWWVRRTGAVVTPDVAYALGFADDPREDGDVRVARDDRWMRRPSRRARTAAVHVLAATAPLHPPTLALATLVVLR